MLENARRQLILVLLTITAGFVCNFALDPSLGQDLKGGVQLIYEVPEEELAALTEGPQGTSVDEIMEQTVAIMLERVDPTGAEGVLVSRSGDTGILVELPWREKSALEAMKRRIASLGRLEMRVVATGDYANEQVSFDLAEEKRRLQAWLDKGGREQVLEDWQRIKHFNENPVEGPQAFGNLRWYPHLITKRVDPKPEERNLWSAAFFNNTQSESGIAPMAPATVPVFDPQGPEWNQGTVPEAMREQEDPFLLEYVAINMDEQSFRGEDLNPASVGPSFDDRGRRAVSYELASELHDDYGEWSEKYINKHSAIILNGVIKSAPYFAGRIAGRGQISGEFTQGEVDELVKVLRTGSLQVEPHLLSDSATGPELGERSLLRGEISLVAGALAVFAFMLWYYRLAGVVACITLTLNLFLLYSSLLFMQATITLPGLGGIVLTMGMAVDANVLIYERIREEAERGKDMIRSVRAGFERAMSAILDSNITTFLTGLVLYNVGVGPVRGFAVTLMVGIVMTVFTQFFVTRLVFHYLIQKKKLEHFRVRRLFAQPDFDYLRFARRFVVGSAIVLVAGIFYATAAVPSEVSLGIDFKGGANLQMLMQEPMQARTVRERLAGDAEFDRDFHNFSVKTVDPLADGTSRQFNVRLKLTDALRDQIEQDRAAWRAARQAAEDSAEPAPPPYVAPYVQHMKRIFDAELARPPSSNAHVYEAPGGNSAFALIDLHFQTPVAVEAARAKLVERKLPVLQVGIPGDPESTQGRNLRLQWTTVPSTAAATLFDDVREALEGLQDVDGHEVRLSEPFPEAQEIQGRMVGQLRNAAIGALILSWMLIIFYLRVRFHEYKYGIAAVAALMHDVLVAFIVVVAFNAWGFVHAEIDLNMIACFLTIIGYSVNDTIVIFDRIRENLHEQQQLGGRLTFREVINLSVNQTMARTVLTTGLTLLVVCAQFFVNWGTDSGLESFAFGMIVGMISGTYSTIFIASPVLTWIDARSPSTPQPEVPVARQA